MPSSQKASPTSSSTKQTNGTIDPFDQVLPRLQMTEPARAKNHLGDGLMKLVAAAAEALGTSPRALLAVLLVIVSGLIGMRTVLRAAATHVERITLHGTVFGGSGSGKSRSLVFVRGILKALEDEENVDAPDYTCPGTVRMFKRRLKAFDAECDEAFDHGLPMPEIEPDLLRYYRKLGIYPLLTTDGSEAGVIKACVASRSGIILLRDEVADLLGKRASNGMGDLLLRSYDQEEISKSLSGTNMSGTACVSFLGATVTDRAPETGLDSGDGLSGRMIVIVIEPFEPRTDGDVDPSAPQKLTDVIKAARRMPLPAEIPMDPAAANHAREVAAELKKTYMAANPGLQAAVDRTFAQIVRIAGVLTVIYEANKPRWLGDIPDDAKAPDLSISLEVTKAAANLWRLHYLSSLQQILDGAAPGTPDSPSAKLGRAMIEVHETREVRIIDLKRQCGSFGIKKADVDGIVTTAVAHGMATHTRPRNGTTGTRGRGIALTDAYIEAYVERAQANGINLINPFAGSDQAGSSTSSTSNTS